MATRWFQALVCAGAMTGVLAAAESASKAGYVEPAKQIAWYHVGDNAAFRLAGGSLPEGTTAVEVILTNVNGDELARETVKREDFEVKGWKWTPETPGYYEVKFIAQTDKGEVPLTHAFTVRRRKPDSDEYLTKQYERDRQGVTVMPRPLKEMPDTGQFGFTYEMNPVDVLPAKLVGFDFARVLVNWGHHNPKRALEPVKGEYHWERLDPHIELLEKSGMEIMGQISFTPKWASPHPEKDNINICVMESSAYAPTDPNDYANFVEMVVNRYKDRVHYWEIWNEPSIPGGSCFWSDTTENYAKILEAGYKAVKRAQPDAIVSLGGVGPRKPYHAFYNRLLKMGMDKYWDMLSLHGAWNSPEDYQAIDARHNVKSKPAMTTEWHAILQGNMQSTPILSENALSLRMMKDLLYQLKAGVERILAFEMTNLTEKEVLPFAIKNRWFTHASGLFRHHPQIEPRLPAVILANFIEVVGRKATFAREFALTEDSVAVELDTARGPLMVFWGEDAEVPVSAIKPFLQPDSQVRDWEGKTVDLAAESLPAKRLYYVLSPNKTLVAQAAEANKLVYTRAPVRSGEPSVKSVYVDGKLFASVEAPATVPDGGWIADGWNLNKFTTDAPDEYSARAAVAANEDGIQVVIEAKDAQHVQNEATPAFWNGDSLQIAFDCEGDGFAGGNTEFVVALTADGPVVWKLHAADTRGDIPGNWSKVNGPATFVKAQIDRADGLTTYRLSIPWSELYPMAYDSSKPIRMSMALNNNDGSGRSEAMEWGGGIVSDKDPAAYGQLDTLTK